MCGVGKWGKRSGWARIATESLPEVWILFEAPLKVLEPGGQRGQRHERLGGIRRHLVLRDRKAGHEIVKVLQHLLAKLVVDRR